MSLSIPCSVKTEAFEISIDNLSNPCANANETDVHIWLVISSHLEGMREYDVT